MIPHKCPVCNGAGRVSRPPDVAGDQDTWTASNAFDTYTCPACSGDCVIWEKEE